MPTKTSSSRRLAAILFADIVGYTTLMQQGESKAMSILNRFKEVTNDKVSQHRGEVIKTYGDGSLILFDSTVDAVRCAHDMQVAFREGVQVPLRIGIHVGEVIKKDQDIFGNGVNIASRVESMGIGGAVLMSADAHRRIKNQESLSTQSLGQFEFKNVEEPIEVFAIANDGFAIPKKEQMKGKFKEAKQKTSSAKWFVPAIIGLIIVASTYYFMSNQLPKVSVETLESRIAILPFENKTNDADLDILGDMAADWLIEGFMNFDDVKIVRFENVKSNVKYASAGADLSKFQKITGAEKIIRGNFYSFGEQLVFQSSLIDIESGEIETVFPKIEGDKNDISGAVQLLQNKILGSFALNDSQFGKLLSKNPPTYQAYIDFTKGNDNFGVDREASRRHYRSAIKKDSSFAMAYSLLLTTYSNEGNYSTADSILKKLKNLSSLTEFDQLNVKWAEATISRDINTACHVTKQWYELDPKFIPSNYMAGYYQANVNKPSKAIKIFEAIDTSLQRDIITNNVSSWWNEIYAHCLIRLERYDEAEAILDLVQDEYISGDDLKLRAQLLIMTGRDEELEELISSTETKGMSPGTIGLIYSAISTAYHMRGNIDKQKEWGLRSAEYLTNQPETTSKNEYQLAESYYHAGDYAKAIPLYKKLSRSTNYGSIYYVGPWHYLSRLGSIYAKQGDVDSAYEIMDQLENIADPTPSGRYTYGVARVKAQLGDKEGAIADMKKALNEGFVNEYAEFRYGEDVDFSALRGIREFDEFVLQK